MFGQGYFRGRFDTWRAYAPILITPPAAAPVTLDEAKDHCRVDFDDQDDQIGAFVDAAVSFLDGPAGVLGRCLAPQTWRQDFDDLDRELRLPLAPVIDIASVNYDDAAGVEQTIDPANYQLLVDRSGAFVRFKRNFTMPSVNLDKPAARVQFLAGYADTTDTPAQSGVPQAIKNAILLIVAHLYENREAVAIGPAITIGELPLGANMLLAPFRRMQI